MFHIKNHQRQLIVQVTAELDGSQSEKIANLGTSVLTVHTSSKTLQGLVVLDDLLAKGSFLGDIYEGFPDVYSSE